jgi:hypothetical protein
MKVHMQVAITIEQLLDLNTMNLLDDLKLWRGGDAGVWQLDQGGGSHLLLTEEDLLARYKSRKDTGKKKKHLHRGVVAFRSGGHRRRTCASLKVGQEAHNERQQG